MSRRRPSPATVLSLVALCVALGGTSYAALKVTGKDVRNNSLTGKDVRDGSLRSADVRDGNLRARDFRAGELPAGATGPTGPAGPPGTAAPAASASTSVVGPVALSGSNTVIDSSAIKTTITTTVRSRILATATATFASGTVANCQLVRETPGLFTGPEMGVRHRMAVGQAATLTGAIVEDAGSYSIGLHCTTEDTVVLDRGDLVVWSVPEPD